MSAIRAGAVLAALAAFLPPAGSAAAQTMPGLDCNLFGPTEPCEPYLLYPPGQQLRLTIRTRAGEDRQRSARIDTLRELFADLRACWAPPAEDEARPGMELSVRVSFKRDGTLLGSPRFTYISRAASDRERQVYRRAVIDSLARCAPLPFTPGMGGAVAGRPLVIRYIDDRNTQPSRI